METLIAHQAVEEQRGQLKLHSNHNVFICCQKPA